MLQHPLWLPKGSVRAILALIIVGVFAWQVVEGVVTDQLYGVLILVLTGYGLHRHVQSKSDEVNVLRQSEASQRTATALEGLIRPSGPAVPFVPVPPPPTDPDNPFGTESE
jgi:hypothetical protein